MKKIFDPTRFGRLFVKHTAEHYRKYLMSLTVLIGIMLLGGGFLVYIIDAPIDLGLQSGMFVTILLLAGTIFTSTVFADFGDKKKAVPALTLPASHFEKYMVAWIYSFLVFLLAYCGSFYLVDWFTIHLKHTHGQEPYMLNIFAMPMVQCFIIYAFLHSIALWGAIFYDKLHFIKTGFLFFIAVGAVTLGNKIFMSVLLQAKVIACPPFANVRLEEHGREVSFNISGHQDTIMITLLLIVSLLIWTAAYYRLKEKQV